MRARTFPLGLDSIWLFDVGLLDVTVLDLGAKMWSLNVAVVKRYYLDDYTLACPEKCI